MKIAQYNVKEKNTRDLSRTDLAHMVTNLRKELKDQINENKELEKKIDGLITVIDLTKQYIKEHCEIVHFEKENVDMIGKVEGIPLLRILERVNESE